MDQKVALRKFKWKDCRYPASTKIARIANQELLQKNVVFVIGRNRRLYQYNKVTKLWHEHYQSQHLFLSRSPGTAMRLSSLSLEGSLFMFSADGGLVEYNWNPSNGWNWIEHRTPDPSVILVGSPGLCFTGAHLFLIGSDGKVYLRFLDDGAWKWRSRGFPYMENEKHVSDNHDRKETWLQIFWDREEQHRTGCRNEDDEVSPGTSSECHWGSREGLTGCLQLVSAQAMVLVSLFPSITSQDSFEFEVTSDVGCGGIAYFSSSLSQSLLITRPSTHCSSKEIHGSHLHPQFEDYKESNRSGRTLISISGLFVWTLQLDKGDEMQDMLHEAFGIPPTSFVDMEEIGSMSMPQPPQNWPQNERDESHDTKKLPDSEQQKQQIGSMSMPQPPQNWPQNERDESHDTKNLPDSEQQKQQIRSMSMPQPPQNWPQNERDESHDTENLLDSNESEEQSKQTRGPTMMHSGWGKDGGNLHIELNEHGQVIGSEGTRLSSKLGVLARNGIFAPLNHKDWRLVPSTYKDRIWAHIKENTNATDDMKCILMMSFGSKWKKSKYEAKTIGYDPYNTDIERLAHCPDRVEEDQWRSLVHYWSSKEAKEKSERNKESRKKLTMPHTSGRKSHSQIINDMNNGVKPTRIEVFKQTHIRANKQQVNEIAGEVMKQMDDLAEVYPELNVPGSAPNDVYSQVMGSDTHGIVRTLGKGASPSLVYGLVYK
ncbi:hypothetical protein KY285_023581 [Solanum tuberosum]|nr:hypothetical protein KY289_025738 [Solanum tuberosum]KAH0675780.1 hypothetical protein KY285_023581 [Solanum tuberosum]